MNHLIHRRRFIAGAIAASLTGPRILLAGSRGQWGDLVGRLVYDGKPPQPRRLTVDKDVQCCGQFEIYDESLMAGDNGGLANVYVYLRSRKVTICPELAESVPKQVLLDNRDCIFKPHCMKIWLDKQELRIVNSDPTAQNVAFSPLGDAPANIVLPIDGKAPWKFQRRQSVPVPIACNYHPWESAFILPRDDPYVDISAQDGTFRIAKLPVGKLEFQVWHERLGPLDTPQWPKGRLELTIQPGVNDLGTIKLLPALFAKKA